MKCRWCNGTGFNRAVYGKPRCPDCHGTGYVDADDCEDDLMPRRPLRRCDDEHDCHNDQHDAGGGSGANDD